MVTWGIAYVMTFITKWTIASLMNNKNEFKAAMSSGGFVNGT